MCRYFCLYTFIVCQKSLVFAYMKRKNTLKLQLHFLLAVNNLFTYSRKQSYRCLNTQFTEPILIKKVTKFSNKKKIFYKKISVHFFKPNAYTLSMFSQK